MRDSRFFPSFLIAGDKLFGLIEASTAFTTNATNGFMHPYLRPGTRTALLKGLFGNDYGLRIFLLGMNVCWVKIPKPSNTNTEP